jgi:sugar phosphate isomerase/epimerase
LPFDRSLAVMNELRFPKMDIAIHAQGSHFTPSAVAADVNWHAQHFKATGIPVAALHLEMPADDLAKYKHHLRAVCHLGRLLTAPIVTIQAALAGADLDAEVRRLTALNKVAVNEGVILTVETNRRTLTADPATAQTLCEKVPGLGLTLDPSHYAMSVHAQSDYEELYPHIRHVRLRDTSIDKMQVRIGQGQIEYGKIITLLEREGYDRCLTVDVRDQPETDYPVDAEVRKLKFLLESMV